MFSISPSGKNARNMHMLVSDFFPLSNEAFEGLEMPVPRNMSAVLENEFGDLDLCRSSRFDHRTESWHPRVTISCDKFSEVYLFVHRLNGE